jgi:gamma-tubulin complex component 2
VREREIEVEVRVENRVVDLDEEDEVEPHTEVERLLDSAPLEIHEAWVCEDLIKHLLQVS